MATSLRGLLIGLAMLMGAVVIIEITSAVLERRAAQSEETSSP